MRHRWTEEEDSLLTEGVRELPGRTEQATRCRVFKLGLCWKEREGLWTEQEDEFLRLNRFDMTNKEMAEVLGRKLGAVRNRVTKIGAVGGRSQRDWTPKGEKSHRWKGGSYSFYHAQFYGREWKYDIRVRVLERDGYECVVCGISYKLQVHHVDPFRETRDHSIGNQVTLCASHHRWAENSLDRNVMKKALRTRDFSEVRMPALSLSQLSTRAERTL